MKCPVCGSEMKLIEGDAFSGYYECPNGCFADEIEHPGIKLLRKQAILKKLDDTYDGLLNLASALHKEGLHDYAEKLEQYAKGISHTIATILEASEE